MATSSRKPQLFTWLGWAPQGVERHPHQPAQVHCAIVLPTKKEFMALTGMNAGRVRDFVGSWQVDDAADPSTLHATAIASPGVLFWEDDVNHARGEHVVRRYDGDPTMV